MLKKLVGITEYVQIEYANGRFWVRVAKVIGRVAPDRFGPRKEETVALVACSFCGDVHRHGWLTGTRTPHCDNPIDRSSFITDEAAEYFIECPDDFPLTKPRRRR